MSVGGGPSSFALRQAEGRLFYGWIILGAAAILLFASGPGQSHTFSVFLGHLTRELGVSQKAVASAYGLATLAAALLLPRIGGLVDRFGPRRMLLAVGSLLGFACIGFSLASHILWLAVAFACLRLLGQGSLMLLCANLVAQWFHERRGVAMSVMVLGFSASVAIHPPLAQWLVELFDWRGAWVGLGIITWVVILPLVGLLVHDRPETFGLKPDGEAIAATKQGRAGHGGFQGAEEGMNLRQAMTTTTFWIVVSAMFTPALVVTALFFYQVEILAAHGIDQTTAANVFVVTGAVMAASMPLVGWLLDRVAAKLVIAGALLLLAATLFLVTQVYDPVLAYFYGVFFGFNSAANMTFFGFLLAHYFGRKHLGSIQGAGQMIGVMGASLGPLPLGWAFDQFGGYDGALRALAVLPLSCAVLALFLPSPAALKAAHEGA